MQEFTITDTVRCFEGPNAWFYIPLPDEMSADLRPILSERWPALLPAEFNCGETTWQSSIMPIKDGPLFIALPAKVRKAENIQEGEEVTVSFRLKL